MLEMGILMSLNYLIKGMWIAPWMPVVIAVRGATFYPCCRRWTIKGCIWQVCIGWDYEENGHRSR